MEISLGSFECGACGATFEAPMLGDMSYGEFLLWSSSGAVAYLDSFADPSYLEFQALLKARSETLKNDPLKGADVLQNLYGPMACDPDKTGAPFVLGALPPCPKCKGRVVSWELIYPLKIVDLPIPPVTHESWAGLSDAERARKVDQALSDSKIAVTGK